MISNIYQTHVTDRFYILFTSRLLEQFIIISIASVLVLHTPGSRGERESLFKKPRLEDPYLAHIQIIYIIHLRGFQGGNA